MKRIHAVSIAALVFFFALSASAVAGVLPSTEVFVAAAAHAVGGGGSFFATDVRVFNPGPAEAAVRIHWLPAATDNLASVPVEKSVAAGETLSLDDIVDTLFHASGAGGLRFASDRPVAVTSRTYNRTATGTFSQFIPGRTLDESLGLGARASIVGLTKSAGFRTNVGFLSVWPAAATANLALRDSSGALLGTAQVQLPPYGFTQLDPFATVGASPAENARLELEVTQGTLLAYGSIIDQSTNDPNFVEPATTFTGDMTIAAGTELVISTTRTFRSHLEFSISEGAIDQVISWDQLYDGVRADSIGCTALANFSTVPGRGVAIAADGSFLASFSGSSATVTLAGSLAADGRASGTFTASVTSGTCTGSFSGAWSGRKK